jgi:hypothetical protein
MDKEPEEISLAEALTELTDKEYKFWQLMDSGKYKQVQAYREAFDSTTDNERTVASNASRLWNSSKFVAIKLALASTKVTQAVRTKEERIASMEDLRNKCIEAKQWGAAARCEELLGKLEGHYIDKSESTIIKQDMTHEVLLGRILDSYGEDTARQVAATKGIPEDTVNKVLGTVH